MKPLLNLLIGVFTKRAHSKLIIKYKRNFAFIKQGALIILACRNIEKANKAVKTIIDLTRNKNIFIEKLNLSCLKSIENFCERIKSQYKCIDVLINNAGILNYNKIN